MSLPAPDPADPSQHWPAGPLSPDGQPLYRLHRGSSPLLVSMPHVGTMVPPAMARRLTPEAEPLADTDWHLPRLYSFLVEMDATVIAATHSRFVIDLNRPPDGANLYPGQDTTWLVPMDSFRREPAWRAGQAPDEAEIAWRREIWWRPYHDALTAEIDRLRDHHGHAALWDAHSIASELPRFFEGRLWDLNFGTGRGSACDLSYVDAILSAVKAQTDFSWILNGRFTGGHITRHYGQPLQAVHAIQLEMSQIVYMDETAPFAFNEGLSQRVRPLLRRMLESARDWRP